MGRLFISYSTKDLALCEEFRTHASALGAGRAVAVWRARDDIGPGDEWKQALFDAVERADVLVALVTADWAASKWCGLEWERAGKAGALRIGVLVRHFAHGIHPVGQTQLVFAPDGGPVWTETRATREARDPAWAHAVTRIAAALPGPALPGPALPGPYQPPPLITDPQRLRFGALAPLALHVRADARLDYAWSPDRAPVPGRPADLAALDRLLADHGQPGHWVPRFGEPVPWIPPRRWDLVALAGLALAALAGGVLVVRARRELPDPPPPPDERPPAPARPAPHALLLDRGDQEALGWGVAQHTAEEAARELDLDRTVLATAAAAGVPTLRYQRRHHRLGAWLWIDRPGTPQLRRFAEEVRTTLDEAGLPVRVSDIQGLPAELADASGAVRLAEVDGDDRRARVLALTDGLAWVDAVDHHPPATPHPTLDELRAWDHLTVVDLGEPPQLAARLRPWRIPVVRPEEAVAALSGEERRAGGGPAALARWEEACALGGEPITAELALRLRAELGLDAPPWWVRSLYGGRLPARLSPAERAALHRRASRALGVDRAAVDARAIALPEAFRGWLAAWRRVRPGSPDPIGADPATGVQLAALQLWDDPWSAVPNLWGWARRGEAARVRVAVGRLVPRDVPGDGETAIPLPWASTDLDPELAPMVAEIGLGADARWAPPTEVERPARRWVGGGLLAGAAAAALGFGLGRATPPEASITSASEPPPGSVAECVPADGGATCLAASLTHLARMTGVAAGATVPLVWDEEPVPCEETTAEGVFVWRCGLEGAVPPMSELRPPRASVHLALPAPAPGQPPADAPGRLAAYGLAVTLLRGSADVVTAGPVDPFADAAGPHLVVPEGADPEALLAALCFLGARPASEVDGWRELPAAADFTLVGVSGSCGNGLVEPGEACDDGPSNALAPGSCRPDCTRPRCGDGVVDPGEACDGAAGCSATCTLIVAPPVQCGDGRVDPGEQCDRGPKNGVDRDCRRDCTVPRCGDGVVDPWEACDGGPNCGADCRPEPPITTQTAPVCGNGKVEAGEECDGGPNCGADCRRLATDTPAVSWTELVWVTVPAGKGVIGTDGGGDEHPRWEVTFTRPFRMLATEVTNAQYHGAKGTRDDMLPVVSVTWEEARRFCEKAGGRLPSEVEWEYAARAGSAGAWSFGDDGEKLGEHAWYGENSGREVHPVATRLPNPWDLYDLHGNVWEWAEDTYVSDAWARYADGSVSTVDPSPIVDTSGSGRVVRGGSFDYSSWLTRSANRLSGDPTDRDSFLGFRCVSGSRPQP